MASTSLQAVLSIVPCETLESGEVHGILAVAFPGTFAVEES